MKNNEYTEDQEAEFGRKVASLLNLKRHPNFEDRWTTGLGSKSDLGLWRTIVAMTEKIEDFEEIKDKQIKKMNTPEISAAEMGIKVITSPKIKRTVAYEYENQSFPTLKNAQYEAIKMIMSETGMPTSVVNIFAQNIIKNSDRVSAVFNSYEEISE